MKKQIKSEVLNWENQFNKVAEIDIEKMYHQYKLEHPEEELE